MEPIKVQQATVRTCNVEVRMLSISGKQVTLAVFRQLQEEHVFDPEAMTLRGQPWGKVHYFWGDCAKRDPAKHLHVVWQKGDELRRCCVEPNLRWHGHAATRERNLLWDVNSACTVGALHLSLTQNPTKNHAYSDVIKAGGWTVNVEDNESLRSINLAFGYHKSIEELANFEKIYSSQIQNPQDNYYSNRFKELQQAVPKSLAALEVEITNRLSMLGDDGNRIDPDNFQESCRVLAREYRQRLQDFRAAWSRLYDQLAALDQLFIAV